MAYTKAQTKGNCWLDASIQAIGLGFQDRVPKLFGVPKMKKLTVTFRKGEMSWYSDTDEWNHICNEALKYVLKHPNLGNKMKKTFFSKSKSFEKFIKKLGQTKFAKLSNEELIKTYKDYVKRYADLTAWGEPLIFYVKEKLTEFIEKRVRLTTEEMNLLLTENFITFTKREEIDLLKLTLKANKKNLDKLIQNHTKKYFWIPYDYGVTTWDKKHFLNEYKKIKDPKKELKNIKEHYKKLIKDRSIIEKRLKLKKKIKKLVNTQRKFSVIMDYKKEVFTRANFEYRKLLEEVAKRIGLTINQTRCLINEELYDLLEGKAKTDKKKLNKRINFSVLRISTEGIYYYITGSEANKIYKEELLPKKRKIKIINGRPVFKGKIKGKVRVITDAKKINEIKEGEILVTYMTSPDYTIGMRKAAAFITDEGGITSHAAIVAREMKKPCIIGTKIATKTLKTGDNVELDASIGEIKIIK